MTPRVRFVGVALMSLATLALTFPRLFSATMFYLFDLGACAAGYLALVPITALGFVQRASPVPGGAGRAGMALLP